MVQKLGDKYHQEVIRPSGDGGTDVAKIAQEDLQQQKAKVRNNVQGAKLGAAGTGMVVGGIVGSIIPGAGTVVGATLGGAIGALLGEVGDLIYTESTEGETQDTMNALNGISDKAGATLSQVDSYYKQQQEGAEKEVQRVQANVDPEPVVVVSNPNANPVNDPSSMNS